MGNKQKTETRMRIIVPFAAAILAQASFALNMTSELSIEAQRNGGRGRSCESFATRLANRYCPDDVATCESELLVFCGLEDHCLKRASTRNWIENKKCEDDEDPAQCELDVAD